jgi:hypothetical protein
MFEMALILRAIVVGAFGGVGLVLTTIYSRRGAMIYPVYASLLVALAMLVARHASPGYAARFVAVLVGFLVASAALYAVTIVRANRAREHLGIRSHVSIVGHGWRIALLTGIGAVVSAGAAFVAA